MGTLTSYFGTTRKVARVRLAIGYDYIRNNVLPFQVGLVLEMKKNIYWVSTSYHFASVISYLSVSSEGTIGLLSVHPSS